MTQEQTRQASGQAEDKRTNKESRSKEVKRKANTRAKGQKRGQERGQKRIKQRRNTPQAPKPPNSTRVQKPHNPRKDPNPYKHTSAPQNALKTPLKREIKPYSQATRQAKQERDKGSAKGRNTPKEREQERTTCTRWTR